MRAVLIGDIHLADRPPSSRTDTYKEDILAKLRWIIDYANDERVDTVISLGDVFHLKRQDRNSHSLVVETANVFGKSNAPVLIVPGNHDQNADRLDSLPSQPLGTLTLHPNINLLMGAHPDFPVFGVPYVDTEDSAQLEYWMDMYQRTPEPLLITHQSIFPEKEAPIYPYVSAESWSHNFEAPHVAYGHIHSRMKAGAFYEVGSTWFCNNGAISRGSLHEETINRRLAVTLYDSGVKGNPYTSVPIPYRPAEEVFLLDLVNVLQERETKVDSFLQSLGSTELTYLTTEGIIEHARETKELPKEALMELEEIISNA